MKTGDRWYHGDSNPEYPVSNYFKVQTTVNNSSLNMNLKVTNGIYAGE